MNTGVTPGKISDIIRINDLDDYAVLFNPSTAETMGLNSTGHLIWELIDGQRTVLDISELIAFEFSIPVGKAREDVSELIGRLYRRMFVKFTEEQDGQLFP